MPLNAVVMDLQMFMEELRVLLDKQSIIPLTCTKLCLHTQKQWVYKVVVVRARYLLVLPAVGGEDVVPHLHAEVQPGQGMTHPHPY